MASCLTLKKSNCKNCYKCIRYCPVKSIRFSGNQAHIMEEDCVLCGQCFVVCPQNAKQIVDETEKVKVLLSGGDPVYASIAPSFVANYEGIGINAMETALKKLGFAGAEETALGATAVKTEYDRILREEKRDVLISSCCHSVNLLIEKYFPSVLPSLADVLSPMLAHCTAIKRDHPGAKTVFIGPCVAKKDEAQRYKGIVDAVLTFEELTQWMQRDGVELIPEQEDQSTGKARLFPTTGGIVRSMALDAPGYSYVAIDGMDNVIAALRELEKGKIHKCFIEMSACLGGCVSGPVMEKYHNSIISGSMAVNTYAGAVDFSIDQPAPQALWKQFTPRTALTDRPTETQLKEILRKMGKTKPEDELNCGSCGYDTCRDKAVAIYQGKAEISMCLPFLKGKAESFSGNIMKNTPNAVLLLNDNLEVQQVNASAQKLLNIRFASDVLGDQVIRVLDPTPFLEVLQTGQSVREKRTYLAEYDKTVEQTIVYDREYHQLICIMRDITQAERDREQKENLNRQTAEVADRVVEKQMRIVQQIASLLGETAAETKIALTKLKESIHE